MVWLKKMGEEGAGGGLFYRPLIESLSDCHGQEARKKSSLLNCRSLSFFSKIMQRKNGPKAIDEGLSFLEYPASTSQVPDEADMSGQ